MRYWLLSTEKGAWAWWLVAGRETGLLETLDSFLTRFLFECFYALHKFNSLEIELE